VVVVATGFLRRVVQLVYHVVNIGHIVQELVERLDVMLRDVECHRLVVALGVG
jgi:hypothetical protein